MHCVVLKICKVANFKVGSYPDEKYQVEVQSQQKMTIEYSLEMWVGNQTLVQFCHIKKCDLFILSHQCLGGIGSVSHKRRKLNRSPKTIAMVAP